MHEGGWLGRGRAKEKGKKTRLGLEEEPGLSEGTGTQRREWWPHHFVLVEDQPIVMGHEAEAVPPLLVVLLVLEEVPREDDAFVQRHLWEGGGREGGR